jgi:hypothetical protein
MLVKTHDCHPSYLKKIIVSIMDMGISLRKKDYNFYFLKKVHENNFSFQHVLIALGRVYCVKTNAIG